MDTVELEVARLKDIIREIITNGDLKDPRTVENLITAYNVARCYSERISEKYSEERRALLEELEPYRRLKDMAKDVLETLKEAVTLAAVQAYQTNKVKRQGPITLRVKEKVRIIDPDALARHLHGVTVDGKPIVTWQPVVDEKALIKWYKRQEGLVPEEIAKSFEVLEDYSVAVAKSEIPNDFAIPQTLEAVLMDFVTMLGGDE